VNVPNLVVRIIVIPNVHGGLNYASIYENITKFKILHLAGGTILKLNFSFGREATTAHEAPETPSSELTPETPHFPKTAGAESTATASGSRANASLEFT
jgi:hypothetical protein